MLRDQQVVGAITVNRAETGLYADKEVGAVADLRRPGRGRDRERAPVQRDEGRAGTPARVGEILTAISNSVTDAQPVFDAIPRQLPQLFGSDEFAVRLATSRASSTSARSWATDRDACCKPSLRRWTDARSGRAILATRCRSLSRRCQSTHRAAHGSPRARSLPATSRWPMPRCCGMSAASAPIVASRAGAAVYGEGTGSAAVLRGPGRDCDRERAPVQRDKEALERQTATAEILA